MVCCTKASQFEGMYQQNVQLGQRRSFTELTQFWSFPRLNCHAQLVQKARFPVGAWMSLPLCFLLVPQYSIGTAVIGDSTHSCIDLGQRQNFFSTRSQRGSSPVVGPDGIPL